jgi:hypothetical protein
LESIGDEINDQSQDGPTRDQKIPDHHDLETIGVVDDLFLGLEIEVGKTRIADEMIANIPRVGAEIVDTCSDDEDDRWDEVQIHIQAPP